MVNVFYITWKQKTNKTFAVSYHLVISVCWLNISFLGQPITAWNLITARLSELTNLCYIRTSNWSLLVVALIQGCSNCSSCIQWTGIFQFRPIFLRSTMSGLFKITNVSHTRSGWHRCCLFIHWRGQFSSLTRFSGPKKFVWQDTVSRYRTFFPETAHIFFKKDFPLVKENF